MILILSDINMPGMTGLELLPKAKAARPDVPVIMITAYGDDSTRRKALEGGAEALLTKPISTRSTSLLCHNTAAAVAHTIGIDTGKNNLHLIGLDDKGAIVLREKIARGGSRPGSPMCRGA